MKVGCLAHVLNLSAKALLVGLDVTDDTESDDDPPELDECSPKLIPSLATNDVARTVIKVRHSTSALYHVIAKKCNSFSSFQLQLQAPLNGSKHFKSYNHLDGS
jgi:hypothetical protein